MPNPILRFKKDNSKPYEDWYKISMDECFVERKEKSQGGETLLSVTIADGVKPKSNHNKKDTSSEDKSKYKIVRPGDIAYNTMRMWQGAEGFSFWEGIVSPAYTVISPKEGINAEFFSLLFKTEEAIKMFTIYSQGLSSDKWNLKFDKFVDLDFYIPCLEEQQKIVNQFNHIDSCINNQILKIKNLEIRKKGIVQQVFSQEIRFKADNGIDFEKWDTILIEEAFDSISDKNHPDATVLTIMQGHGTIPREESDRNISYNKDSIPSYKLVKENDFIVHLRSFEGGLEIATREGIVSPAYTILRNKVEIIPEFYRYYFRSSNFIIEKLTGITEGIRDGRSLNMDDFWILEIPYPSISEQKKIAGFINLINQQIEVEKEKLEAIKNVKKGLLQQMFI